VTAPLDPHLFVIFGGTGDLAARKLLPAIHEVITVGGATARILAVGRGTSTDAEYRRWASDRLSEQGYTDVSWIDQCHYHSLGPDGDDFEGLIGRVQDLEADGATAGNRVLYLALPPAAFAPTITAMGDVGLPSSEGWVRLVIEKPFGVDGSTAAELGEVVHRCFAEEQVYRIDHFLGKEAVQNLLTFRFANPLFETAWNRDRIGRVEITVAESKGVDGRAEYYDRSGVVRDMLQNHLTQLLALVAMEPPPDFAPESIRSEKVKVLSSVRTLDHDDVSYAQYEGYHELDGVADDSRTPTYARAEMQVASWRWEGVPFVLRSGKQMPERETRIDVFFRHSPVCLFHDAEGECLGHGNVLSIRLQPDEGFRLRFSVKVPGERVDVHDQELGFDFADQYGPFTDAYATLVRDDVEGDPTLFVRYDEVRASWRIWDPVLDPAGEVPAHNAGTDPHPTSV
jgi:glucose-6-phosphate 1-dehydrogenase